MENYIAQRPVPGGTGIKNPALGPNLINLTGAQFFSSLLPALITLLLVIGSVVFVFMLLIGGIQWITSGGDKIANEEARKKVTNAIIGLLVLFSVFAIISLVELFFGIDLTLINIDAIKLQ